MADSEPSSSSSGPSTQPQPPRSPRYHFDPKTMTPFQLMKLPLLPRRAILEQLNIIQILELTMISQKFKASTAYCGLKIELLRIVFGHYSNMVKLNKRCSYRGLDFQVCCKHPESETEWVERRLNGEKVLMTEPERFNMRGEMTHRPDMKVLAETEDNKWELIEKIKNHLMAVVKVEKFKVTSYRGWDQRNQIIWNIKPRIEKINLTVAQEPNSQNYPWMSFDTILSKETKCPLIKFNCHGYPSVGINRLFKEWIAGKRDDLEDLVIRFQDSSPESPERNDSPCLEGIVTQKTFYEEKFGSSRFFVYWLRSPIVDVKRATDGRLASIVSDKHTLGLHVWHEKHLMEYREAMTRWGANGETNGSEEPEEDR